MGWLPQKPIANPLACRGKRGGVSRIATWHAIQELLFFTFFYLYLWFAVEPHLLFHGSDRITNFPSFYRTWTFFASHLSHPGGLVEYLSAFLSQLLYFSWLGALVITMQALTLGSLLAYVLREMGLGRLRVVRYVPALLLLVIYGQYTYFFPTTMALLCALAMVAFYVRPAMRRTPTISATFFVGLSLACYYAAGAAMLLFAITCAILELSSSGRRRLAVLYVLVAGGLPYVFGVKVFGISLMNAYSDLLPISWRLLHFGARRRGIETVYALYLLVPGIVALGALISSIRIRARQTGRVPDHPKLESAHTNWWRATSSRWSVQTTALFAITGAVAYGSLDGTQKTHFAVDYYAYHRVWSKVLAEGRKGQGDPFVVHTVNRALYHTGQLGDSMFAWPQEPGYLLLKGTEHQWAYWQNFAAHMELGFMNYAENALMECLAGLGDRPMILQQLAMINMVKGNLDTARVCLRALSTTLFHDDWAKHYLYILEQDPDLATDRDVQNLRSIAMAEDYATLRVPEENMLSHLLERNRGNRMAFEYLMAWYLLNRQLTRFVNRLEDLRDLGYETLPRHYEEAVLVYTATARTTIELRGYEPQENMRQQTERFLAILQSHGGDKFAAFADLAKSHGDTYAFYNVYGPREKAR